MSSLGVALLVALGGAVGAPLRFVVGHYLDSATDGSRRQVPWGTFLDNVVGSALLGLFSGLALDDHAWALLGVGFCGALTTYSAFAVQAVDRGLRTGFRYVVLTVPVCLAACALGFVVAG